MTFTDPATPDTEHARIRRKRHQQAGADKPSHDRSSHITAGHERSKSPPRRLGLESAGIATARHFAGRAEELLAATAEQGLEGMVAKRRDAAYREGARARG